jgi:hypothetical protein
LLLNAQATGSGAFRFTHELGQAHGMTNIDAYALQHSDLNGFLFAAVGNEANGMTLSVLSALARLEMDPWQEAGRLATLPATAAVDGLARIIAAMPAGLWSMADATIIAGWLVTLLPDRRTATAAPRPPAPTGRKTPLPWIPVVLTATVLVALALAFIGQSSPGPDSNALAPWPESQPAAAALSPDDSLPKAE